MITPASSDLLIAPPNIPDPRFRKSVLMLTHDHNSGSFALCVNKLSKFTLPQILEELELEDYNLNFPLYWGGPVNQGTVWMLHSTDWECEHTVAITTDWAMTSHISMFAHLADGDHPEHFRICMGYCSWSPGQLKNELAGIPPWNHNNSWLVANNLGPEWLFEQPEDLLWENATTLCSHQAVDSWI